jgi:GntR family transcriptional regulator/MocR family aminotransferase
MAFITHASGPGYRQQRPVGVPVDRDGIRVDLLRETDADAVILTPSHQWPTGSVLSAENRTAVLRWAAARGAIVIEDDYDAEYRYDRTPVGALQGLAPDRVVYAGSASKTLAPGLRLGWFVLPGHLTEPMAAAKIAADRGSAALEQLALADLITRGEFDRHLRRMRPVYRRRRDALLAALDRRLPARACASTACGPTASAIRARAASSSATPRSTSKPSRRESTSWPALSASCERGPGRRY